MTIIKRDVDGRILEAELDSEKAAEMGRKRWADAAGVSATDLVKAAGYPDLESVPEHVRLLAEIASAKKANSVSALGKFLQLTGQDSDAAALLGDEVEVLDNDGFMIRYGGFIYTRPGWIDGDVLVNLVDYLREKQDEPPEVDGVILPET